MGPEIDQIFRRLDQKVIDREVARAAIKQLVGMHARAIAGFDTANLHHQIDEIFEHQQATHRLPPCFVYTLNSAIAEQFAKAREVAEADRVLLISD